MEHVILVDENDSPVGEMEKTEAHRKGVLHRAFSILLVNSKKELLLQKRAYTKYHSGGLWTNTCCSHPLPNETLATATRRKLIQEMGIDLQPTFAYKFIYKAMLDNDFTEHECDHVFTGYFDGVPVINTEEVQEWKFMDMESLQHHITLYPAYYTEWFKLIMKHPQLSELLISL